MKYVKIFILLIVLISFLFILQSTKDNLTFNEIAKFTTKSILYLTSKASSIFLTVSIATDLSPPKIYIDHPQNITYTSNINSIPLNFTIVDDGVVEGTTYYNVDNGNNVTVTGNTTFAVNETTMSHILTLFANDTKSNLNSSSVTFSVKLTAKVVEVAGAGGGGGGGGGGKTVLANIEIITPGFLNMLPGDSIISPIIIRNSGQTNLNSIFIDATTNTSYMSLQLDKIFIPVLVVGEEERILLTIRTRDDAENGQYEVLIKATSGSPQVSGTARTVVFISDKDFGRPREIRQNLEFARKLFESNPECLELVELLNQAEEALNLRQYDKASGLIDAAVQSCKDLLAARGKATQPPSGLNVTEIATLILEFVVFILVTYGLYYYYKRRKVKSK